MESLFKGAGHDSRAALERASPSGVRGLSRRPSKEDWSPAPIMGVQGVSTALGGRVREAETTRSGYARRARVSKKPKSAPSSCRFLTPALLFVELSTDRDAHAGMTRTVHKSGRLGFTHAVFSRSGARHGKRQD